MKSIAKTTSEWARNHKWSFWFKEETTSTNDMACGEAFNVKHDFKIYCTHHQTQGRGRCTNSWKDTGNSFLSSWSYKVSHSPQPIMGLFVGLALFNSCQFIWPNLKWSLKAPNDLFLVDKKVAGLLLESIQQGDQYRLIIGLGMNVNDHPQSIEDATHIASELGRAVDDEKWWDLLNQLQIQFKKAVHQGTIIQISEKDREDLLTALNVNPLKQELFLEVTDQGNLITESQTLAWSSL